MMDIKNENQAYGKGEVSKLDEFPTAVDDYSEIIDIDSDGLIADDEQDESYAEEKISEKTETGVQCDILPRIGRFFVENFANDAKAISFYTGFKNYEHFLFVFHVLGPAARELKYSFLSPENQLFLTLMKLRRATDDFELTLFFGITKKSVEKIFEQWVKFMYFQLKELDIWPSKTVIQQHMPPEFRLSKRLSKVRLILHPIETPIEKPFDDDDQHAMFNEKTRTYSLRTIIGCSPRGVITYVSDSYGGSGSVYDREIIEHSVLFENGKMLDVGDSVVAEPEMILEKLFAKIGVRVVHPDLTRRMRCVRRVVRRIDGLKKTYKILREEVADEWGLGGKIVFVCCMLSNFNTHNDGDSDTDSSTTDSE